MGSERPRLSVIVPSYNPGEKIPRCLEALKALEVEAPFEIIVVDSGDDGTAEALESDEGVRLVRSPARLFPGTTRNRGAEAASGSVLSFIDADCVPSADWLQRIIEARPAENRTAVGGAILNGTPESAVGSAEYFSELSGLLPGGPPRKVDFLPGANFAVGAEAFREVGGMRDYEKGSDVTFGRDCRAHGIQPLFRPEITVAHFNRTDARGFLRNQEKLGWGAGNNRALFDLPGSWMARRPPAWPLAPLARLVRVLYRSARDGRGQRLQLLKAAPWIFAGSLYFGVGFARGARDGRKARRAGAGSPC